jgi:hypothetical protein
MMRVVSCHGARSAGAMVSETTYFSVAATSVANSRRIAAPAGVVRIGRPVVLVGQERRAPAEEHRIGAAQQLGVVLLERLVRAVVLVEVVVAVLQCCTGNENDQLQDRHWPLSWVGDTGIEPVTSSV